MRHRRFSDHLRGRVDVSKATFTCTAVPATPRPMLAGPAEGALATGAENAKAPGASDTGRSVCVTTVGTGAFGVTTFGTFGLIGASTLTVWV